MVPERVTWKSKDGKEIVGMLYVPPGEHAKGSLPLMEWVHGGPEGQDRSAAMSGRSTWRALAL